MGRYDFDKERAIKGINPLFYNQAHVVIVNDEGEYLSFMKNNGVMFATTKDIVMSNLRHKSMKLIIVDTKGRILDTNLDLCEECGEPIVNEGFAPYCSLRCKEDSMW